MVYGKYEKEFNSSEKEINVNGKKIKKLEVKNPVKLPWGENKIEIVFEGKGFFTEKDDMQKHLKAGAAHVIPSERV